MQSKDLAPRYKVQLRGGFSDRNNIKPENKVMQYQELDERTRTALINNTCMILAYMEGHTSYTEKESYYKSILMNVFLYEFGTSEYYDTSKVIEMIKTTIRENSYDEVFSLLEFMVQNIPGLYEDDKIVCIESYNTIFEKEYVGYRFVQGIIVPITDENEIKAIKEVGNIPYDAVKRHISKAMAFLSDRETPDYENSIKESISAVEAICKIFTGTSGKNANLGSMLKKIEDSGIVIHRALKSAFTILYGYTSDANGIRHAGDIGGPSATFEEAKFMLISCCAFINYLIGVSSK